MKSHILSFAVSVTLISINPLTTPAALAEVKPQKKVLETTAEALPDLISKHPKLVIQFTSKDKSCKPCAFSAEPLDEAVDDNTKSDWTYARVQWDDWRTPPSFTAPVVVKGIPDMQVFIDGKFKGNAAGRFLNASDLMVAVDRLAAGQPAKPLEVTPPPDLDSKTLKGATVFEESGVLGDMVYVCTESYPEIATKIERTMDNWDSRNESLMWVGSKLFTARMKNGDRSLEPFRDANRARFSAKIKAAIGAEYRRTLLKSECSALERFIADYEP